MKINSFSKKNKRWAEGAIVYQIYPRSFYDSNADGIGDIPGIIKKISYLNELGVNAIWLSPFYPSPMADFGYDVADYCGVDPIFGKLADMKKLVKKAHAKRIKVLVDLVPNHSSDEHEWFRQSRQSREDKYSDWYIWRDSKGEDKDGQPIPPNNWLDIFTGNTAWQWEPARQQFYLHSFDVHQPDLNWTNKEVREAIKAAMRFWLDMGVDGFRVDAVRFMGKEPNHKDNPLNPEFVFGRDSNNYNSIHHHYSQGWPELFNYLSEMADVLKEAKYKRKPRFMVTESYPQTHEPVKEYLEFYEHVDPKVAAPFNFEGLGLPWQADAWQKFLDSFHTSLDNFSELCVASYAFGNHDQPRLATRLGDSIARSSAVMLLTLPGMAFIYNGEEIGMVNGKIPKSMIQDPAASGGGGRDPERTPLEWDASKNAGFTTADKPWLPIAAGYKQRNIIAQRSDPSSYLSLYKNLSALRNKSKALSRGSFSLIETGNSDVLGYVRRFGKGRYVILVNFSNQKVQLKLNPELKLKNVVVSSSAMAVSTQIKDNELQLESNQAVVAK